MTKLTFKRIILKYWKQYDTLPPGYDEFTIEISNELSEIIMYLRRCGFKEKPVTSVGKLSFLTNCGDIIIDNILQCDSLTVRHGIGKRRKMAESHAVNLMHLHSITVKQDRMEFIICHRYKLYLITTLPLSQEEYSIIKDVGDYFKPSDI